MVAFGFSNVREVLDRWLELLHEERLSAHVLDGSKSYTTLEGVIVQREENGIKSQAVRT